MTPEQKNRLRALPSVDDLLNEPEVSEWIGLSCRALVVESLQEAVDQVRRRILADEGGVAVERAVVLDIAEDIFARRATPSLRRVINATGIILHTNLGRAPLCGDAVEAVLDAMGGYCNVEMELESGKRGRRERHVEDLIRRVTGAEAGVIVNNNAAATLIILNTIAKDREVVVSRGQLIEIGGSFRLPDVMAASGAHLREVGTTNRTRLTDYERAISDQTAAFMCVHTSNYRIVGFTEETPISELATLARRYGLVAIDDIGSGALVDLSGYGVPGEPIAAASIEAGADLICFSGDKLLGGPQAGIIAGRKDLIDRIRSNPLMRTYRTGKLTLLAMEATLRQYFDRQRAFETIPTLAMIAAETSILAERAGTLCGMLEKCAPGESFYVCSDSAYVGGGSAPAAELASVAVQWRPRGLSVTEATRLLRDTDVPVIVRVHDDAICFDLRTIGDDDFDDLVTTVGEIAATEE